MVSYVRSNRSIRVRADLWETFQELYPNQASQFIEKFLEDFLSTKTKVDREELAIKLKEIEEEERKREIEKRALQMQLAVFSEEEERKKDLFESENAQKLKEAYFSLSPTIREKVGVLCQELEKTEFEELKPAVPFIIYSKLSEDFFSEYMSLAEENNYFELRSALKRLRNALEEEKGENGDEV